MKPITQIICRECNAYIHECVCECMDSSIKWNMCKDIHYINKQNEVSTNIASNEHLIIDGNAEPEIIIKELSHRHSQLSLSDEQESFTNTYTQLIRSLTNSEQLQIMRNCKIFSTKIKCCWPN